MKTQIKNLAKAGAALLLAAMLNLPATKAENPGPEFEFLKERDGIDLFYRWMEMPEGKSVRQMKAVLEINACAKDVLNLLKDESRALDWIPSAEQFRHLTATSGDEWASYIQFAIPWPFADQDCILAYAAHWETDGSLVIDFECKPEFADPVDGITRMKDIVGSFVIRPGENGRCVMECYFLSKKASKIPRWITEPIITGNILNLVGAIREELSPDA